MEHLIQSLPEKNIFIQIGTNNGNDLFRKYVQKYNPKKVILIEPNTDLIDEIKKNYSFYNNELIILNVAINTKNEEVTLYKSKFHGHIDLNFSLAPMNDWGETINDLVSFKSKSITFEYLCALYNIKYIDFLQIDTEGFDSEIINSINFDTISIELMRFEDWGFDKSCFTKFSNNINHAGKDGINTTVNKLLLNNYNLYRINDEDGNDIVAYKDK
jgi:hypothetical protein